MIVLIPLLRASTTHKGNYTIEVSEKLKKIAFPVVKGQRARPIAIYYYFFTVFWLVVGIVIIFANGASDSSLCFLAYTFATCVSFFIGPIVEAIIKYKDEERKDKRKDFVEIVVCSIIFLAAIFFLLLKAHNALIK